MSTEVTLERLAAFLADSQNLNRLAVREKAFACARANFGDVAVKATAQATLGRS